MLDSTSVKMSASTIIGHFQEHEMRCYDFEVQENADIFSYLVSVNVIYKMFTTGMK